MLELNLLSVTVVLFRLILFGRYQTEAAAVIATSTLGIIGNNGHSVACQFTGIAAGDRFRDMSVFRGTSSTYPIVEMSGLDTQPLWNKAGADRALQNRSYLSGSPAVQFFRVTFTDTRCEDRDLEYGCVLQITTPNGVDKAPRASTRVQVAVVPLPPDEMKVFPAPVNSGVMENTELKFTCQGNVGFPAGSFQWYIIAGTKYTNVTSNATEVSTGPATENNKCVAVNKTGTFAVNATATASGHTFVVCCRLYHVTLANSKNPMDCGINDAFSRMSHNISVYGATVTRHIDKRNKRTIVNQRQITGSCSASKSQFVSCFLPGFVFWWLNDKRCQKQRNIRMVAGKGFSSKCTDEQSKGK